MYASVLKQGRKRAPQVKGYVAAAAALSGIPAIMKAPTKKKCVTPKKRRTMDPNKFYLDSAATYHNMFIKWYLKNIRDAGRILRGNCNAGVKVCSQVGDLGIFKMWLNEGGIANLLSIPQLEKNGFRVTTDTHGEWVIHSPQGEKLQFK